jgi:hypothetical protein
VKLRAVINNNNNNNNNNNKQKVLGWYQISAVSYAYP